MAFALSVTPSDVFCLVYLLEIVLGRDLLFSFHFFLDV